MIKIILAISLTVARPQAELPSSQEERIPILIRDLGSDDPSVRDQATAGIVAIGRPALRALQAMEKISRDPEVRSRAAAVLRAIHEDLRWDALKLEVSADRGTYRPGDTIVASVQLKNVEDFPVTVFLGDGIFVANARAEVMAGATTLPIVVPSFQVVGGAITVDEKQFRTIEPGKSVEVYTLRFEERWDLGEKDPGLKASYSEDARRPLKAGSYSLKAGFAWGFKSKNEQREFLRRAKKDEADKTKDRPGLRVTTFDFQFSPKAEQLIAEVWQGSLEGTVEFQVSDK